MKRYDLIIVGAGASGLMAAISAGEENLKVLLIEKNQKSATKMKITGKGRCNITNTAPINEFVNKFGKQGRFLYRAFSTFFSNDIISLLESNGTKCITERGGRVFPETNQAIDVVKALLKKMRKFNIEFLAKTSVETLIVEDDIIKGVKTNDSEYFADNVIVATGGLSYSMTGSTGDGYKFAQQVNHKIETLRPALVPLNTYGTTARDLEGLSLKNVKVSMFLNKKIHTEEFGDMLFTRTGVSGPIILKISSKYTQLSPKDKVEISIDFKPALDYQTLDKRLEREFDTNGAMQLKNILRHLLPNKMIPVCLKLNELNPDKLANQINKEERKILCDWLKDFKLEIRSARSIEEAIVTAGGISLKEINPQTMESKKIKNLYFVGEVLDLDGETGGYNLQAAFSTGYLAGKSLQL